MYAFDMHTPAMEIEFDPAKAAGNLAKHKVSFAHAEQALRDPLAVTMWAPARTCWFLDGLKMHLACAARPWVALEETAVGP
jgi:hypothetical protein